MTETKEIIYNGITYTVPVWVRFVATDESSAIYGYELKPYCDVNGEWNTFGKHHILYSAYYENAKDSLVEY